MDVQRDQQRARSQRIRASVTFLALSALTWWWRT
jgi:hypothetical protein